MALSIDLIRQRIADLRSRCENSTDERFTLAHFTSVFGAPTAHWGAMAAQSGNFLLTAPYLAALEQHPYGGMTFHYVLAYEGTEPVGILYFQETDVHIAQADRNVDTAKLGDTSIIARAKGLVARGLDSIKLRLLVHGNLLQSGEHASFFAPALTLEDRAIIIHAACKLAIASGRAGKAVKGLLIKDVTAAMQQAIQAIDPDLTPFSVQPNMVMALKGEWQSFEDVMEAYSSKYRVRAKAAMKKAEHLRQETLGEEAILRHTPRIMELFKNVEAQSDFHMTSIHPRYFVDMKAALGDRFSLVAYFMGEEMVGFRSCITGMGRSYASFVGIDYAHNRDCQLYQNMLYGLVGEAIHERSADIDLARTAMEIKSTVGAEPVTYRLLVKHLNGMTNSIVKRFITNIKPKEWEQRRPFKE